jgi:hypothetical protein
VSLPEEELSDHELRAIEDRCRTASPSPWFSYVVGRNLEAGLNCIELGSAQLIEVVGATVADQDFIANARQDVPNLLRYVRSLQQQLAAARACEHLIAAAAQTSGSVEGSIGAGPRSRAGGCTPE